MLLGRLSRLERTWAMPANPARVRARLAGLPHTLDACERRIARHLEVEERTLYPRLHAHLPDETGTLEAALREHDTLRQLIELLRHKSHRLAGSEAGVEGDIEAALHDLVDLWRLHARRVDDVIAPLLARLPGVDHG